MERESLQQLPHVSMSSAIKLPASNMRWLKLTCWTIVIVLGGIQSWNTRYTMNEDGMSYVDLANVYSRGDWSGAINGYWSPLYSWLVGILLRIFQPTTYWEFPVVHLTNFLIFLFTLACFNLLLRSLIQRQARLRTATAGSSPLPDWAWFVLGHLLFAWSALDLITTELVSPDMLLAAFVYAAAALLLRIQTSPTSSAQVLLFGVVVALAYLSKAILFPVGWFLIIAGVPSAVDLRSKLRYLLLALIGFLAVSGSFIAVLSLRQGRLTFGDSGKLNYAWYANGVPKFAHWQGQTPGSGMPVHPTRQIFDQPAVYEFATPIGGTYPVWYDPTYWYEGIKLHFDLRQQVQRLVVTSKTYSEIFFSSPLILVLWVGLLVLQRYSGQPWRMYLKQLACQWRLLLPALAAGGLYALVHVESRLFAPFAVLIWLALLASLCLREDRPTRAVLVSVASAVLIMAIVTMVLGPNSASPVALATDTRERATALEWWRAAEGLHQLGVLPGADVAYFGDSFEAFWAHLARVRIIAEAPKNADLFWTLPPSRQAELVDALRRVDVQAIVTDQHVAAYSSDWHQIGTTHYYVYLLGR